MSKQNLGATATVNTKEGKEMKATVEKFEQIKRERLALEQEMDTKANEILKDLLDTDKQLFIKNYVTVGTAVVLMTGCMSQREVSYEVHQFANACTLDYERVRYILKDMEYVDWSTDCDEGDELHYVLSGMSDIARNLLPYEMQSSAGLSAVYCLLRKEYGEAADKMILDIFFETIDWLAIDYDLKTNVIRDYNDGVNYYSICRSEAHMKDWLLF